MPEVFRTLPIRALGYGYAIGEALAYVVDPTIVDLCYSAGSGFMVAHVVYTVISPRTDDVLAEVFYNALWEGFASAILPTWMVYHVCGLTYKVMYSKRAPAVVRLWLPTAMGILCMPFILKPLDDFVDQVLTKAFS